MLEEWEMDGRQAMRGMGIALAILGAILLAWSIAEGHAAIDLFLIIPIIHGTGALVALSFLLFFVGVLLMFLSVTGGVEDEVQSGGPPTGKNEWGGVILLGPIPIVLGSGGFLRERWVLVSLVVLGSLMLLLFLIMVLR